MCQYCTGDDELEDISPCMSSRKGFAGSPASRTRKDTSPASTCRERMHGSSSFSILQKLWHRLRVSRQCRCRASLMAARTTTSSGPGLRGADQSAVSYRHEGTNLGSHEAGRCGVKFRCRDEAQNRGAARARGPGESVTVLQRSRGVHYILDQACRPSVDARCMQRATALMQSIQESGS